MRKSKIVSIFVGLLLLIWTFAIDYVKVYQSTNYLSLIKSASDFNWFVIFRGNNGMQKQIEKSIYFLQQNFTKTNLNKIIDFLSI